MKIAPTKDRITLRHELIHSYYSAKIGNTDKRTNVFYAPLPTEKAPSPKEAYPQLDAKTDFFHENITVHI